MSDFAIKMFSCCRTTPESVFTEESQLNVQSTEIESIDQPDVSTLERLKKARKFYFVEHPHYAAISLGSCTSAVGFLGLLINMETTSSTTTALILGGFWIGGATLAGLGMLAKMDMCSYGTITE